VFGLGLVKWLLLSFSMFEAFTLGFQGEKKEASSKPFLFFAESLTFKL
jgi:hypothetical protein